MKRQPRPNRTTGRTILSKRRWSALPSSRSFRMPLINPRGSRRGRPMCGFVEGRYFRIISQRPSSISRKAMDIIYSGGLIWDCLLIKNQGRIGTKSPQDISTGLALGMPIMASHHDSTVGEKHAGKMFAKVLTIALILSDGCRVASCMKNDY